MPNESINESVKAETYLETIVFQPDGTELILTELPEKVLVLSSATLELLSSLDIEIAATGSLMTRPDLAEMFSNAVDVGMATSPDMEIVASVAPDIIIVGSTFISMQERFEAQGYNAWFVKNQSYEDILTLMEDFGRVFQKQDEASSIIHSFEERRLATIDKTLPFTEGKTAMIITGAGDNIMFGRENSFPGSLIEMLGVENITSKLNLGDLESSYVPFSFEQAIELNPDIIFRIAHGDIQQTSQMFDEYFDQNPAYVAMRAVIEGNVYDLDYNLFFSNPGLKVVDSIEAMSELLMNIN